MAHTSHLKDYHAKMCSDHTAEMLYHAL